MSLGAGFGPGGDITLQNAIHLGLGNPGLIDEPIVVSNAIVTFAGQVVETDSGQSRLLKRGPGTLRLEQGNNWLGGTRVEAGTLIAANGLSGGSATGPGGVEVQPSATLGGSGAIWGATTIRGTLSPGEGVGTIGIGGYLLLDLTAWLDIDIAGPASHDIVVLGSGMDVFNARLRVHGSYAPTPTDRFFIVQNFSGQAINGQFRGALNGSYVSVGVLGGKGWAARVSYHGNHVTGDTFGGDDIVLYDFNDKIQGPQFWDGSGPANNFVVDGGSGNWTVAAQNWTDIFGSVNLRYNPDGDPNLWFTHVDGTVTLPPAGLTLPTNAQLHMAQPNYIFTGGPLELRGDVAVSNNVVFANTLTGTGSLHLADNSGGVIDFEQPNTYSGGTLLGNSGVLFSTNQALGTGPVTIGDHDYEPSLRGVLEANANCVLSNAFYLRRDWPLEIFTFFPNHTLTLAGPIGGDPGSVRAGPLLNLYAIRLLVTGEITNTATLRHFYTLALGRDQTIHRLTILNRTAALEAVGDTRTLSVVGGDSIGFQDPEETSVGIQPRGVRVIGNTNFALVGAMNLFDADDSLLRQTRFDISAPKLLLHSSISGSSYCTLVKQGVGTLQLLGEGSGGWATRVDGGTLLLSNAPAVNALGTGPLTVGAQGTLAGRGTIWNDTTTNNGVIAPGDDTPGVLKLNSSTAVRFNSYSGLRVVLQGASLPGGDYDQLQVNSPQLQLINTSLQIVLRYAPGFADKCFVVTGAGSVDGFFLSRPPGSYGYAGQFGAHHYAARISYTGNAESGAATGGHDILLYEFKQVPAPPRLEVVAAPPGQFAFRFFGEAGWAYQTQYALPGALPAFFDIPGAVSGGQGQYLTNTFPLPPAVLSPDKGAGPWTNSYHVLFRVGLIVP